MSRVVLLTGATGFVGRQVLRALGGAGVAVRAVVREGKRLADVGAVRVERVVPTRDLFQESEAWWTSALDGVDTVIHAAWYAEPGKYLQSPINMECLRGTLTMAVGAARAGVRRFVGVGSCTEYDSSAGDLSVHTALRPDSPYAAAKVATFHALERWLPAVGVEFAWCRLFYLFGEDEDPRRLAAYLHQRLAAGEPAELTAGSQTRDFLDVREAGRMIAAIALGSATGPVNVCSGVGVTVREFAERIADGYGRRDLLRFGARPENAYDPPRIVGVP